MVWMFTLSVLNSRIIGQMLNGIMATSIAADIDIVMRFQPPSLDSFFHIPRSSEKLTAFAYFSQCASNQ